MSANLTDYFGDGTGGGSGSGIDRLSQLVDVSISTPADGQTLKFESGLWVNGNIDFSTLLNKPTIPNTLNDLTDVNTTGVQSGQYLSWNGSSWIPVSSSSGAITLNDLTDVSVSTPSSGQALIYNGTSWVNQPIDYSYITNAPTAVTTLDSLSDVTISGVSNNQYLKYNGTNWANSSIAYADITGKPTVPVNGDFTFVGLSDTSNSIVNNGYLKWNSNGTNIEYTDTIPVAVITGLDTVATTGLLSDLNDVAVSGAATGQYLQYNGTNWVPANVTISGGRIANSANDTFVSVVDTAGKVIIQGGPDNGAVAINTASTGNIEIASPSANVTIKAAGVSKNIVLKPNTTSDSSAAVIIDGGTNPGIVTSSTDLTLSSSSNLNLVSSSTGYIYVGTATQDGRIYGKQNVSIASDGNVKIFNLSYPKTDGVSGQVMKTNGSGTLSFGYINLADLGNVSDTAPTTGQILQYNGTEWIPSVVPGSGVTTLNDLTDVTIVSPQLNEILHYTGSQWQNTTLSLDFLDDVDTTTVLPTNGQVLKFNGITWVPGNVSAGASALSSLTDVSLVSTTSGQYLRYNGTSWSNATIAYTDISGRPSLHPVATSGSYTDLTNKPTIPTNSSFSFVGLSDTDNTVINNGFLRWNSSGTSISYVSSIPAASVSGLATVATTGSYTDLTDKPTLVSLLNDLTDVNTTGATNGQVLGFNGTNWVPATVSGAGSLSLDGLTDVTLLNPMLGQYLQYNGTEWVNSVVEYAYISHKPTIPVNNSFSFVGLNDTSNSTIQNGFLRWDSSGTTVVYTATIPAEVVSGLSTVATTGSYADLDNKPSIPAAINDLSDVDTSTSTPSTGQSLIYDGTNWVPGTPVASLPDRVYKSEWIRVNYTPGDLVDSFSYSAGISSVTVKSNVANNNLQLTVVFNGGGQKYPPNYIYIYGYKVTLAKYTIKPLSVSLETYLLLTGTGNPFGNFDSGNTIDDIQVAVTYTGAAKGGPTLPTHAYVIFGW